MKKLNQKYNKNSILKKRKKIINNKNNYNNKFNSSKLIIKIIKIMCQMLIKYSLRKINLGIIVKMKMNLILLMKKKKSNKYKKIMHKFNNQIIKYNKYQKLNLENNLFQK